MASLVLYRITRPTRIDAYVSTFQIYKCSRKHSAKPDWDIDYRHTLQITCFILLHQKWNINYFNDKSNLRRKHHCNYPNKQIRTMKSSNNFRSDIYFLRSTELIFVVYVLKICADQDWLTMVFKSTDRSFRSLVILMWCRRRTVCNIKLFQVSPISSCYFDLNGIFVHISKILFNQTAPK